jgi:CRISPR system Cascade subunit CasD
MLAAAQGRARTDSIEDLLDLDFAVRADQPGTIISDLQTEHSTAYQERNGIKLQMPLSHRYYISDAKFVVAVKSRDSQLITSLEDALRSPKWPLFLGRRSCPPDYPVVLRVREDLDSTRKALEEESWQAAPWYQRKLAVDSDAAIEAVADVEKGEDGYPQMDSPISFNPEHRQYESRAIHRWRIGVEALPGNEYWAKALIRSATSRRGTDEPPQFHDSDHDPMGA